MPTPQKPDPVGGPSASRETEPAPAQDAATLLAEQTAELKHLREKLKQTQAQLLQQEKLAGLGALAAGIVHEIKNPLNFVNNFAQLSVELAQELQRELASNPDACPAGVEDLVADLAMNAERIHEHGRRADRIVKSMLEHARAQSRQQEAADINALVEEYAELAYHGQRAHIPELNVKFERSLDPLAGSVDIVSQEIARVLLNLFSNAFYAVQQKAQAVSDASAAYQPTVSVVTERLGDAVEIRITDNGGGIPEAVVSRIFEPFFTTKPPEDGAGLGLSLSHEIVTMGHGGNLLVQSKEGEGTTFTIRLPIKPPVKATPA